MLSRKHEHYSLIARKVRTRFKGCGGAARTEPFIGTSKPVDVNTLSCFALVERNTESREKLRVQRVFQCHGSQFFAVVVVK